MAIGVTHLEAARYLLSELRSLIPALRRRGWRFHPIPSSNATARTLRALVPDGVHLRHPADLRECDRLDNCRFTTHPERIANKLLVIIATQKLRTIRGDLIGMRIAVLTLFALICLDNVAHAEIASYYGQELAGRRTASGERFNPSGMTAAHRTLRFGTRVRVTNTRNGRSVVVRINDRGPFVKGRSIDLSSGAARAIGMGGSAHVQIKVIR